MEKSHCRRGHRSILTAPKHIDETTQYARDVVSGKIVAGELVIKACKRHLDDLDWGAERGLTWDADSAQDAIEFFPAILTITEGAKEGEPFTLLPWHVFVVGSIFGWKDSNGFIRFRFCFLETGKGQAKSPLMAAIGIYLLGFNEKKRAAIYCIGQDKATAKVMFEDACAMVRAPMPDCGGDTLKGNGFEIRGSGDLSYKLEHIASGSKMLPIANGEAVSGPKPVAVMGDEVHEMKSGKSIEMWKAAIDKKHGDAVMMLGTNTPGIDQPIGTEYSEMCQRVMRGEAVDDTLFAYIARTDTDDDPFEDESCWIKSLPALGITYDIENIRQRVQSSKNLMSKRIETERLFFGIPVGSAGFFIDEGAWRECLGEVSSAGWETGRVHLSLDLSDRHDLSAMSVCLEGKNLKVKTTYYTHGEDIKLRSEADHIPYRELERMGQITITNSAMVDYSVIAADVIKAFDEMNVVQLAMDASFGMRALLREFDEAGFPYWLYSGPDDPEGVGLKIVRHQQGKRVSFMVDGKTEDGAEQVKTEFLYMPASISHLEDKILSRSIVIEKSLLTDRCASNTVVDQDGMANKMFDKKRSRGRIDGMVTIAMAVGSATTAMNAQKGVYSGRAALVL